MKKIVLLSVALLANWCNTPTIIGSENDFLNAFFKKAEKQFNSVLYHPVHYKNDARIVPMAIIGAGVTLMSLYKIFEKSPEQKFLKNSLKKIFYGCCTLAGIGLIFNSPQLLSLYDQWIAKQIA